MNKGLVMWNSYVREDITFKMGPGEKRLLYEYFYCRRSYLCNLILSADSLFIAPGMAQTFVFIDKYRPEIPT